MVLCAVCHAGRPGARKDKGPKASKEAALRAAEERAARLADAAQRQDRELLAAEAWRSALSRAAGDKVLDDPKLLRRSIKRDQKDRARKGKRWAERVASQQEQQRSRQERCVCVATLASGMRGMGGGRCGVWALAVPETEHTHAADLPLQAQGESCGTCHHEAGEQKGQAREEAFACRV